MNPGTKPNPPAEAKPKPTLREWVTGPALTFAQVGLCVALAVAVIAGTVFGVIFLLDTSSNLEIERVDR